MNKKAARRIAIIDDSEIALEFTAAILEREGFSVIAINSPIGASVVLCQDIPDLVLVDRKMASLSGERVVTGLRRMQRFRDVPMVLYSDDTVQELEAAVAACGASGFIRKTNSSAELIRGIKSWLP